MWRALRAELVYFWPVAASAALASLPLSLFCSACWCGFWKTDKVLRALSSRCFRSLQAWSYPSLLKATG